MNYVKMASGADADGEVFMNIEAAAELKMIYDDDTGEYVKPEEGQEGFKSRVALGVPQPVMLSGGVIADATDGVEVGIAVIVTYPDGTEKVYVPTISSTKILWKEAS